ncbi:MAG: GNAT family N-acetyltransferase [Leptolyngbyaceae cyanobacterium SM2_3_12]|nr:GNAT family N-acetyltransferase [Leptolyngbyaceae cyanobacterium SM2_3_12]
MTPHSTRPAAVALRGTQLADLPFVLGAERHPDNRAYIGQWSYERHSAAITAPDEAHLIIECLEDGHPVGYAILMGLTDAHQTLHLKRIVVTEKGQGYGRLALGQLQHMAFETYQTHRFWLDVKTFNPRARHLYESVGFVLEGCLREALKTPNGYQSMYLMAMLEAEYRALARPGDGPSAQPSDPPAEA